MYKAVGSIYKNVYKAPPTGFSAFPVDQPRADSRDMSQPYAHRAEIERLDQRPGSTSGSAARELPVVARPQSAIVDLLRKTAARLAASGVDAFERAVDIMHLQGGGEMKTFVAGVLVGVATIAGNGAKLVLSNKST